MRVLLVGGNGFIGSHVQDVLLARGYGVRVLDRVAERYRPPSKEVDYRIGSSSDPAMLAEAVSGVDAVLYLASTTVPATSNMNVAWDIDSNLVPLTATLDAMVKTGVARIVFLSSGGTVYGPAADTPILESAPTEPICSYGIVKLASEKYLAMYRHLYGIRPVILRPSNVFGPRASHDGVQGFVGTSLARVYRGEPIEIWGDGSVVRDYLYVEDLAKAVQAAVDADVDGLVNIGSGEGRNLLQVLETLATVTGMRPQIAYRGSRAFDVPSLVLDIGRARTALGWAPATAFGDGVTRYWGWLSEELGCGKH